MLELIEAVEAAGGEMASGRCQPTKFTLKIKEADGVARSRDFLTTGCGSESRFIVPYTKQDQTVGDNLIRGAEGTAVLCANDDRMDLMPRFQGTR